MYMSKSRLKTGCPQLWSWDISTDEERQILYHVAVKAGFYRKAVEMPYLPVPTTYSPALNRFLHESAQNYAVIPGHSHIDARNTSRRPTLSHKMPQDAEKSQPPEVGREHGPL